MRRVAYLALAVVLCAFGYLALFSVGAPFLLTGVAMLAVFPWRGRRTVLWPTLASIWALSATYLLIAPLGCTSTAGALPAVPGARAPATSDGVTVCTNLLGLDYSGGASYQPPLLPALAVGIAVAIVVASAIRALLARRLAAA